MIPCQRSLFSIPSDVVYLNTAYMSPLMTSVVDAINYGAKLKATPWDITISDFFENSELARNLFADIVNVSSKNIALVPSASYGLETAAKNLWVGNGRSVVILENQFPSHVYPWQRLVKETGGKLIKVKEKQDRNLTELVLDLTQSLGAMNTDLGKIDPDFAVIAAYKWMMSPYSTGYLYVNERHWNGEPLEGNWISRQDGKNFSNLINYTDHYEDGAVRFDVGERANFALLPGAIKALKQIEEWGVKNIEATLRKNNSTLAARLCSLGLSVPSECSRGPHFIGAKLPTTFKGDILDVLSRKKIYVSERGGVLRITPHLWNSATDFDRLIDVLSKHI